MAKEDFVGDVFAKRYGFCLTKSFDRLIKMGQVKDGSTQFITCDRIGQDGLYHVEGILREVLVDMANTLGPSSQERLSKAFPYVFGPGSPKPQA